MKRIFVMSIAVLSFGATVAWADEARQPSPFQFLTPTDNISRDYPVDCSAHKLSKRDDGLMAKIEDSRLLRPFMASKDACGFSSEKAQVGQLKLRLRF